MADETTKDAAATSQDKPAKAPKKQEKAERKGFHLFHPAMDFTDEPLHKHNWFMYVAGFIIRPVAYLLFRIEVRGKENIPAADGEPVLYVANHVSFSDPVVMWVSTYPRVTRFLARSNLWRFPVLKGIISRVGAIPVDPESADTKAIKRAAAALKRGECVGIFAEGTRMRNPEKVYKPHAGFVLIANMGKAKIVPVGITGTDRIKPPGQKLLHLPKVTITYGEAFSVKDFADVPKAERTQAIVDETMRRVFELRDAADFRGPIRPGLPPFGIVDVDTAQDEAAE